LSYFNDGRYELKVLVNGDIRRIVIDDRLPFDSDNKLVGISTGAKNQLWPSFVEKAYMKLMGGYDFPGSNSAVDLHVLTGWIPEHIDLQSGSFERERTWSRITTGFLRGDCMMTVGTNDKTALNIHNIKLLPSHDYAVTEIKEMNDERWVTLLDSRICGSECECGGSGSCPSKSPPLSARGCNGWDRGPRYTLGRYMRDVRRVVYQLEPEFVWESCYISWIMAA
jgi:calpain-7